MLLLLDELDSSRPLISTSWFAWVFKSAESPSSKYVVPLIEPLVPAVAGAPALLVELDPLFAAVLSTHALDALELDGLLAVVPEVPTAPLIWLPCSKQPETVIVSALLLLRLDCEGVVVCADAPPQRASAIAATPPIHTFRFMLPPSSSLAAKVQHPFHGKTR